MNINTIDQFSASVIGEHKDGCADECCELFTAPVTKPKRVKWTIEKVRDLFEQRGFDLREPAYKTTGTKMHFFCRKGQHEHVTTLNAILAGKGCGKCKRHWTLDKVRDVFDQRGLDLLETLYVGTATKMRFFCRKGQHEHTVLLSELIQGGGCGKCRRSWTIDAVRAEFDQRGMDLLETEFKSVSTKMRFFCRAGQHEHSVILRSLLLGGGCGKCKNHWTLAKARKEFDQRGLDLRETVYVNTGTPMRFFCRSGKHEHQATLETLLEGGGCGKCFRPWTLDIARTEFDQRGLDLLAIEFRSVDTKMRFFCRAGEHEHSIALNVLLRGVGCGKCRHWTIEEVREEFDKRGFDLLEKTYKNASTKMRFFCRTGKHEHSICLNAFMNTDGCGKCAHHWTLDKARSAFDQRGLDLLDAEYENMNTKMRFFCRAGQHEHETSLAYIMRGSGCGKCAPAGFNVGLAAILYYVRFMLPDGRSVYKIGITNNSVATRYSSVKTPYELMWQKYIEQGTTAAQAELSIKRAFSSYRCPDKPVPSLSNTELFDIDILPNGPNEFIAAAA